MVTEENHADWKFEIRTIDDHFFKTNFGLDIGNTEDFVQSAFEVELEAQLDNHLPVGFKLAKEHLAESGRVLGKVQFLSFLSFFSDFRKLLDFRIGKFSLETIN